MARPNLPVTIEDLKVLVPSVTDGQAEIFISSADAIIKQKGVNTSYAPDVAYNIELFVAAHFASISSASGTAGGANAVKVKVGNSEESYSDGTSGFVGIASSRWGQDALMLDYLGLLNGLATNPVKAQFQVYGRDSDADEYAGFIR